MSPIVSDLTYNPGGTYDIEFRDDYDTQRHKLTAAGTLVKMHPYHNKFSVTVADFRTAQRSILQPLSNQIRTLFGYGNLSSPGWSFNGGISYDFVQRVTENEIAQISYNGSCCGITFEYRRLDLGTVPAENQFRVSLVIANIGTFRQRSKAGKDLLIEKMLVDQRSAGIRKRRLSLSRSRSCPHSTLARNFPRRPGDEVFRTDFAVERSTKCLPYRHPRAGDFRRAQF